jgi:arginase family enzyme
VVGFDVVEIAPVYDQGVSAVQAAKVIFEILCQLEKSRKAGSNREKQNLP